MASDAARLAAMLRRDPASAGAPIDEALIEAAVEHGVAPLVYRALRGDGTWERQPDRVRDELTRIAAEAVLLEALRRDTDRTVIAALAAAGVAPLIFKGAALACRHYPEPWLRPRSDTDLLIREHEQARAAATLEKLGAIRAPRPTGDYVTHQFTYILTTHGLRGEYDIHWKIADPQVFSDVLTYDELARDAVMLPALGPAARAIGDVHSLLIACTHRVAHHYDSESLCWLYDIALLARRLDDPSWNRVLDLASRKRIHRVCARGLGLAAELFGAPVPPRVMSALLDGAHREPSETYLRGGLRRVDILRSDLKALGSWRARAKLLREHLLPPRAFILASYGQVRAPLLPVLYLHRIVRGAFEWFRPLRSK
jgi:hypothetical protein